MPIRGRVAIEEGVVIGENLDTGYGVVLREGCIIGDGVKIWSNTVIDARAQIGDNVRIHCNCYVAQECVVGDDVFIGPGTQLLNDKYPVRTDSKWWEPAVIGDGAVIGGGVTILPGVRIGKWAVIGAGAVVTKSVPQYEVWWGSPARFFSSRVPYGMKAVRGPQDGSEKETKEENCCTCDSCDEAKEEE